MTVKLSNAAKRVLFALETAGYRADVVGGSVRDALLGKIPHDFDLTTSATPDEMKTALADFKTVETGIKHGTLTVLSDGEAVEVTTYRVDGGYLDHRHPTKVTFTDDLREDLARRDFTVNAMCYHPTRGLTDLFGGGEDLTQKRIRCVGEPERRFDEDALRMLRALRFSSVLGFTVENDTARAIHELYPLLADVSAERIYAEWRKLLVGQNAIAVLHDFADVFAFLFPKMPATDTVKPFSQDTFEGRTAELFWHAQNAESAFLQTAKSLKTEKTYMQTVAAVLNEPKTGTFGTPDLLKLRFRIGDGCARLYLSVFDAQNGTDYSSAYRLAVAQNYPENLSGLALNGMDVLALGITGEAVGKVLLDALFAVYDGKVENEKDALCTYAKTHFLK